MRTRVAEIVQPNAGFLRQLMQFETTLFGRTTFDLDTIWEWIRFGQKFGYDFRFCLESIVEEDNGNRSKCIVM